MKKKKSTSKKKIKTDKPRRKINVHIAKELPPEKTKEILDTVIDICNKDLKPEIKEQTIMPEPIPQQKKNPLYTTHTFVVVISCIVLVLLLILIGQMFLKKDVKKIENPIEKTLTHTIIKKDNLWDLSYKYYSKNNDWVFIYFYNTNSIKFPDLIFTGNQITIPFHDTEYKTKNMSKMYFDLYKMYKNVGWYNTAEGMLYLSYIYNSNYFMFDSDSIKDWNKINNGKHITK
jgi:hypothetical protein